MLLEQLPLVFLVTLLRLGFYRCLMIANLAPLRILVHCLDLDKNWDLTKTSQQTKISSQADLVTLR